MNQSRIIAAFVRGAAWQLMRRSPTWLLLPIWRRPACMASRPLVIGMGRTPQEARSYSNNRLPSDLPAA